MPSVLYSSPFVPPEWIAAWGHEPCRALPFRTDGITDQVPATEGLCPYARSILNMACAGTGPDAVVMTTRCDQMRRACEVAVDHAGTRVFLMNLPTTWQTPSARNLYRSELVRLGDFLEDSGGTSPEDSQIREAMLKYDGLRGSVLAERESLGARGFIESMFGREPSAETRSELGGIPLATLGGSISEPCLDILDLIERAGGNVVLDGTDGGDRALPARIDARALAGADPRDVLVDAYFNHIPDIWRRPNSMIHDWLVREQAARKVRGVVLVRHVWCDLWHAEVQRIREWLPVPLLDLVVEEDATQVLWENRIEAFMETVR